MVENNNKNLLDMKSIGVTLQRTYLRKNCKKKYFVTSSYLTSLVDITLFSITPNSFYNVIHWTCQSNSRFIRRENYYLENHIFFFQMSWKDDLSKKIVLEFDLSCIIGKDYISFSQKYGFTPDGKQKMIFLKKKNK